jgi:hypothetical protein
LKNHGITKRTIASSTSIRIRISRVARPSSPIWPLFLDFASIISFHYFKDEITEEKQECNNPEDNKKQNSPRQIR